MASPRRKIKGLSALMVANGAHWVTWPRRAGRHVSDITDNLVREKALALKLVDVKVAALDENRTSVKVTWRTHLRDHRA
ncbi:MAG: hypothetical protein ABI298_08230 [Acidimicrobiales bacterium]